MHIAKRSHHSRLLGSGIVVLAGLRERKQASENPGKSVVTTFTIPTPEIRLG